MPDAHEGSEISEMLTAAFAKIHAERMHGVPILNPRLAVEVIDTRLWNGEWLSLLVTPWFINLMLLPATAEQAEAWQSRALGSSVPHRFPAGRFDFLVGEETGLGRYQMCSLFSPVLEFEDQEAARLAGQAALEALFDASLDDDRAKDAAPAEAGSPAEPDATPTASGVSRRGLLTGKIAPKTAPEKSTAS
jgi:[NiFe] hydrogenase assembly HybE family chaperone